MTRGKPVALYVRVSTTGQTVDNQKRELEAVAGRHGWQIVVVFEWACYPPGISVQAEPAAGHRESGMAKPKVVPFARGWRPRGLSSPVLLEPRLRHLADRAARPLYAPAPLQAGEHPAALGLGVGRRARPEQTGQPAQGGQSPNAVPALATSWRA